MLMGGWSVQASRTAPAGVAAPNVASSAERGAEGFATHCAPCHQTDGRGLARLGAPLRDSPWVLGREDDLITLVLHGLQGDLLMPPMRTLEDVRSDIRLKRVLKRAVEREYAPEYLGESIKRAIRG